MRNMHQPWALRASAQIAMAEGGLTDVTEGFSKARDDAERAIALDPTLTSAYLALAKTQINCDWNWDAANASITKAGALEPGSIEVLRIRSYQSRIWAISTRPSSFMNKWSR